MILFDDNSAPNLSSAATAQAEPEQNAAMDAGSAETADTPQPTTLTANHDDKHSTSAGNEDFASALENFTTETEEQQSNDDHVIKGAVLKVTPTHMVVDNVAK